MDLRLAWREYHDGERVDTGGLCDGEVESDYRSGGVPEVELDEVEPGEHGALTVCARTPTEGHAVWTRLATQPSMEHGRRPLEVEDGDDTPNEGELDDHLHVEVFAREDCGLGGTRLDHGPLANVADGPLGSGVRLGESPNTCLAVEWRLPESVPPTVLSDSVRFGVEFAAVQTRGADGERNPWGGES
jgi:hypothetical protein